MTVYGSLHLVNKDILGFNILLVSFQEFKIETTHNTELSQSNKLTLKHKGRYSFYSKSSPVVNVS